MWLAATEARIDMNLSSRHQSQERGTDSGSMQKKIAALQHCEEEDHHGERDLSNGNGRDQSISISTMLSAEASASHSMVGGEPKNLGQLLDGNR
jgi:hypothetical protein